jgi:hypothetical protein
MTTQTYKNIAAHNIALATIADRLSLLVEAVQYLSPLLKDAPPSSETPNPVNADPKPPLFAGFDIITGEIDLQLCWLEALIARVEL